MVVEFILIAAIQTQTVYVPSDNYPVPTRVTVDENASLNVYDKPRSFFGKSNKCLLGTSYGISRETVPHFIGRWF